MEQPEIGSRPGSFVLRPVMIFLFVSSLFGTVPPSLWAIDIQETHWGFDGRVQPARFNLLSVLVSNPGGEPVETELALIKSTPGGTPVDAPLIEPVFLAPFSTRWVQFTPFVTNDFESWSIRSGRDTFSIPNPRTQTRQNILLDSGTFSSTSRSVLRAFPENLFPPSVTATDALQLVVLDRMPRWEEARRQAFIDWLSLGGMVVVLHQPDGSFPRFSAELSPLNTPLTVARVGGGHVYRLAKGRGELTREELQHLIPSLDLEAASQKEDAAINNNYEDTNATESLGWQKYFSSLKQMSNPDHNWVLLHVLFWAYIAAIFPGVYLCSQKWTDYRIVYLILIGVVVVFSGLFVVVGRRGYGESTSVETVAIIRPLSNGAADVAGWSNAFVTSGGNYQLEHQGSGALYSSCQSTERVNGLIRNGTGGSYLVDIPPFSSREFAYRIRSKGPLPELKVSQLSADAESLRQFSATLTGLKKTPEQAYAVYRNKVYSLRVANQSLELGMALGSTNGFFKLDQFNSWSNSRYYSRHYSQPAAQGAAQKEQEYQQLWLPLLLRSQDISQTKDVKAYTLSPDLVRVFLYSDLPEEFLATTPLGAQSGRALYVLNVPLSGP